MLIWAAQDATDFNSNSLSFRPTLNWMLDRRRFFRLRIGFSRKLGHSQG